MESSLTESEADTLFSHTRTLQSAVQLPAARDSFLEFVRIMGDITPPSGEAILVLRRKRGAEPEVYPLRGTLTLGRRQDCTISIPELETLSGLHFHVDNPGTGWQITDLSRNGTHLFPGTRRLPRDEPYLLKDGDLLWVEGLVLVFKHG